MRQGTGSPRDLGWWREPNGSSSLLVLVADGGVEASAEGVEADAAAAAVAAADIPRACRPHPGIFRLIPSVLGRPFDKLVSSEASVCQP